MLQDCVRRIKENFNKEFDEVLRLKEAEISRILEKNTRICKIANDLKVDEPLVVPSLHSEEQPERLLTVQEEEVTVEKYVSPEEKKRLEKAAKIEEERRLKEKVCRGVACATSVGQHASCLCHLMALGRQLARESLGHDDGGKVGGKC